MSFALTMVQECYTPQYWSIHDLYNQGASGKHSTHVQETLHIYTDLVHGGLFRDI